MWSLRPCGLSWRKVQGSNNNHAIVDAAEKRRKSRIAAALRWAPAPPSDHPLQLSQLFDRIVWRWSEIVMLHALSLPLREGGMQDLVNIFGPRRLAKTSKDRTGRLRRFWYRAIVLMSCQVVYPWGLSRPKYHGDMWQVLAHWKKVVLWSGVGDGAEKGMITKYRG